MNSFEWFDAFARDVESETAVGQREIKTMYCLTEGDGSPVKIGITCQPKARFIAFQMATSRPIFICWGVDARQIHETALKFILRGRRTWGEWFEDPQDETKRLFQSGDERNPAFVLGSLAISLGVSPTRKREPRRAAHVVQQWKPNAQEPAK